MTRQASNGLPRVVGSLCSRFRTTKSACVLCAEVCPKQAVRPSNEGPAVSERCVGCGACYSICPTGAFELPARADLAIIQEIRDSDGPRPDHPFAISCRRADTTAELILPCLGRLTEALLIAPLAGKAVAVEIRRPPCERCSLSKAVTHLDLIMQRARSLYEVVGLAGSQIYEKRVALRTSKQAAPQDLSRRGFVGALGKGTLGLATMAIPDLEKKQGDTRTDFREVLCSRPENLKRSALLESLKYFSAQHEVVVSSENALLAEIEVERKCTGCGTCALLCPTAAIRLTATEKHLYFTFKPAQCVNCRVCQQVCNYDALDIKAEAIPSHLFGDIEIVILEAAQKTCPICQERYMVVDDMEFCPLCIDRARKSETFLAKKLI